MKPAPHPRVESATQRAFDLLFTVPGLIVLAPFFLVLGAAVKLHDGGPVFYRGRRMGRGGRPFELLKFRTMVINADRIGSPITSADDPRVTPVGRFLRRHKLDELPQLFNVVAGDMSLVGPRPEDPRFTARYSDEKRESLMEKHLQRQEQLFPHIQRLMKKQPLVTAAILQEYGISPGKTMGELLKAAEHAAITRDIHDPQKVVALLKETPLWPMVND